MRFRKEKKNSGTGNSSASKFVLTKKRIISFALLLIILVSVSMIGFTSASANGTGAGLAEWAMKAYNEGWSYVYGGSTPGAVDCSGLIYSYCGGARGGGSQLSSATATGYVSAGVPRVHGLGLYQPGHVGVYVGNGMAVDARGSQWGVCYQSVYTKSWTQWFKLAAISYVNNGWEKFNGNYYYYEDGQYVVDCSREIGGVTYNFSSSGISDKKPADMNAVANKNSNSSVSADKKKETKATQATTQAATQAEYLKVGSSGDKVTKLQERLKELGFYNDEITGYFGEKTEEAYMSFQEAANVTVDGIAGKSDLDILYSSSAPEAETEEATEETTEEPAEEQEEQEDDGVYVIGEEGDEVVNIQNRLTELGYFHDVCTGYYGDLTSEAIMIFQTANGLEATGEVDEETYNALFSENAVENIIETEETEEETSETTDEISQEEYYEEDQETATQAIQTPSPSEKNAVIAKTTITSAQKSVMKTNKIAKKAFAGLSTVSATESAQTNNRNFMLWLLIVGGIVILAAGSIFTLNKREKYECAHAKSRAKTRKTNVRYW